MSKFFPVSQKNIFPVSQNFSLCQSKIPCVFPVWKKQEPNSLFSLCRGHPVILTHLIPNFLFTFPFVQFSPFSNQDIRWYSFRKTGVSLLRLGTLWRHSQLWMQRLVLTVVLKVARSGNHYFLNRSRASWFIRFNNLTIMAWAQIMLKLSWTKGTFTFFLTSY